MESQSSPDAMGVANLNSDQKFRSSEARKSPGEVDDDTSSDHEAEAIARSAFKKINTSIKAAGLSFRDFFLDCISVDREGGKLVERLNYNSFIDALRSKVIISELTEDEVFMVIRILANASDSFLFS
jgi:hypothetical protein